MSICNCKFCAGKLVRHSMYVLKCVECGTLYSIYGYIIKRDEDD